MPSSAARALVTIALLFAPSGGWAYQRQKLVVVVDQRAAGTAAGDLGPTVSAILGSKGYDVLAGRDVEEFIRAQGIAQLDAASTERIAALLQQFRADALLQVKVTFYLPEADRSIGPRANAAIGVLAERRGGDGKVNWRSTASARSDESFEYLGRQSETAARPQTLVSVASERVLWSLPRAPEDPALVALREEQKRKLAQHRPPPAARRPPDPQGLESLLKKSPSFRTGPRFRLRLNKMRFDETPAAPAAPKPVPEPAAPTPSPAPTPAPAPVPGPVPVPVPVPVPESERARERKRDPAAAAEKAKQAPDLAAQREAIAAAVRNALATAPGPSSSSAQTTPASAAQPEKRDVAPSPRISASDPVSAPEKLLPGAAGERQLQAAVAQKQPDVNRCVDGQLKRVPTTSAKATVLITVDRAGRVTRISVDSGKLKGSYFEQCLKNTAVKSWVFPRSGSEYELELPIHVVAKDG